MPLRYWQTANGMRNGLFAALSARNMSKINCKIWLFSLHLARISIPVPTRPSRQPVYSLPCSLLHAPLKPNFLTARVCVCNRCIRALLDSPTLSHSHRYRLHRTAQIHKSFSTLTAQLRAKYFQHFSTYLLPILLFFSRLRPCVANTFSSLFRVHTGTKIQWLLLPRSSFFPSELYPWGPLNWIIYKARLYIATCSVRDVFLRMSKIWAAYL